MLACSWEAKLKEDEERLAIAVENLKPFVGRLVILNQPPVLPKNANRVEIRQGARPPFFEDPEISRLRRKANVYLERFVAEKCAVIDIASHFQSSDGEVYFLDDKGRQLYHDKGHLSGFGAELIRAELKNAITQ